MPRANLWNKSVPRAELHQRARDARLRLERIERLLVPRAAMTGSWLGRVFYIFGFASYGARSRGRPLRNRRPSHIPTASASMRGCRSSEPRITAWR
jgi:hypothetical protein